MHVFIELPQLLLGLLVRVKVLVGRLCAPVDAESREEAAGEDRRASRDGAAALHGWGWGRRARRGNQGRTKGRPRAVLVLSVGGSRPKCTAPKCVGEHFQSFFSDTS